MLNGFDRLVARGSLRRLNYGMWDQSLSATVARGMEQYLGQIKILFKDYAEQVKGVSEQLKRASLRPFEEQKLPVLFLRSPSVGKEELARRMAPEKKISRGLVCAFSTLEVSPTF